MSDYELVIELVISIYEEEIRKHVAENAKLRELVKLITKRHAPTSPCRNTPCRKCPMRAECDREDELWRELGVEVDA